VPHPPAQQTAVAATHARMIGFMSTPSLTCVLRRSVMRGAAFVIRAMLSTSIRGVDARSVPAAAGRHRWLPVAVKINGDSASLAKSSGDNQAVISRVP
jgi:hypothetical protein